MLRREIRKWFAEGRRKEGEEWEDDWFGRDGIDPRLNRTRSPISLERRIAGKFIWRTFWWKQSLEAMRTEA